MFYKVKLTSEFEIYAINLEDAEDKALSMVSGEAIENAEIQVEVDLDGK